MMTTAEISAQYPRAGVMTTKSTPRICACKASEGVPRFREAHELPRRDKLGQVYWGLPGAEQ